MPPDLDIAAEIAAGRAVTYPLSVLDDDEAPDTASEHKPDEKPLTKKEQVLRAWQAGHTTPAAIVAHTGLPKTTVAPLLSILRGEGKIPPSERTARPGAAAGDHGRVAAAELGKSDAQPTNGSRESGAVRHGW